MKSCIDCRHFTNDRHGYDLYKVCSRRDVKAIDVVDGLITQEDHRSARRERKVSWFGFDRCGPEGKYFDARPVPTPGTWQPPRPTR